MKKLFLLFFITLLSCSDIEVNDVSISITPYNKADRGKFWNICIDSYTTAYYKAIMYFQIHPKKGKSKEYRIDFIHLKEKCNKKNILVSFTNRYTSIEEYEWLKNLGVEDIDYINVGVKKEYSESKFIFNKKILSKNLK